MKSVVIASLIAGSLFASGTDASAADLRLDRTTDVRGGAFAGARFRLPLGSGTRAKPQLALTFAPTLRTRSTDGRSQVRFGEGVAFGFADRGPARLSLAGRPLGVSAPGAADVDKRHASGVSTFGWVAIGVGTVVAVAAVAFTVAMNSCPDYADEC